MINLQTAKAQAKVTHDLENDLIKQYINAAYVYIAKQIDKKLFEDQAMFDADNETPVAQKQLIDAGLDQVALFLVSHFYSNREAVVVMPGRVEAANIPITVDSFLSRYQRVGV